MATKKSTRKFQADVSRLLHLVVNSLYSNKEIFLRELISNSSDAIDRLKLAALTDDSVLADGEEAQSIRISTDRDANTITIEDDGVGMTRDELAKNLGTVAHSGTLKFLEEAEGDAKLIGQFGVGFYSSFLVSDRVDVVSRAAGSDEAWKWSSDAKETYTLEPAERDGRGTTVTLHLADEHSEYVDAWRLRTLISRYSDYVSHPIELLEPKYGDDGEATTEWSQVNEAAALWQRSGSDLTDEQYNEFYQHLTHDFTEPLARTHFKIEGTQLFTGLLFIPGRAASDLFWRNKAYGVRLFVKRVFIMDDADELVPGWLRFIKGVIDSDDLPLNVSRELLQESRITRTIRKQVVKKTLEMLKKLAEDDSEKYLTFWTHFGAVFKEGLHEDPTIGSKMAPLLRYRGSANEGMTSLAEYVERMPEGQEAIYYALGETEAVVAASPHLEALRSKGFEVLYMTDPIDEWAIQALGEFDGKKLVSAAQADLGLDESDEEKVEREEAETELKELIARFAEVLDEQVAEVRLSSRLTDSPACLVVPEGGSHAHLERLLRAHDPTAPQTKRILEVNPTHPLIRNLHLLHSSSADSEHVTSWIEMLFDQTLLAEGSPVVDPGRLARRMTALLEDASSVAIEQAQA
jgi:molecular chaperone HtpG